MELLHREASGKTKLHQRSSAITRSNVAALLLKGVHIEQPVVNQNCHAEPNGRSIPTCAMPESDSIGRINQQNPVL